MAMATKKRKARTPLIHVRWAIARDLLAMEDANRANGLDISRASMEAEFRDRNTVPVAAEVGERVVGYAVMRFDPMAKLYTLVRLVCFPLAKFSPCDPEAVARGLRDFWLRRSAKALAVTLPTEWITDTVRGLCRTKAPAGILADALQDAGCEWGWLLDGLRGEEHGDLLRDVFDARHLAEAVQAGVRRTGPYFRVRLVLYNAPEAERWAECDTLRECSDALRGFIDGDNPRDEPVGVSALGRRCGDVAKVGALVSGGLCARVSYNGRVWASGEDDGNTEEFTGERLDAFAE